MDQKIKLNSHSTYYLDSDHDLKKSEHDIVLTFGNFNHKKKSKKYNNNKVFDENKCVLHLIDLTPVHITNYMCSKSSRHATDNDTDTDTDTDTNTNTDSESDTDTNSNFDSGYDFDTDYDLDEDVAYVNNHININFNYDENTSSKTLSDNNNDISLDKDFIKIQKHLKSIIDYITDQHCELWNMMKRGDLLEDISMSQFNERLESLDDFSPTRGRYIVEMIDSIDNVVNDNDDNDDNKNNTLDVKITKNRLTGADVIRNGLTIKYLFVDYGKQKILCHTTPINMHTITDFPIGYFDDVIINDYLCPCESPRTSWGLDCCLISLDVKRLHLNKLTNNNIFHVSTYMDADNNSKSILVDYLYIIITFKKIRYMLISEYSSKLMRYDMKVERQHFIDKFRCRQHMYTYDKKSDKIIKRIAAKENVAINNVLCI